MKPLQTVPLTPEDLEAYSYCYGFVEGQSWDAVMIYVRMADRRDAALMLYAQQRKLVTWMGPPMIHVRNSVAAYWADPDVCERSQP